MERILGLRRRSRSRCRRCILEEEEEGGKFFDDDDYEMFEVHRTTTAIANQIRRGGLSWRRCGLLGCLWSACLV